MALEYLRGFEFGKQVPWSSLELDEAVQFVGHFLSQSLLIDQLFLDFLPWFLVKFVDAGADRLELTLFTTGQVHHRIQELPMIDLDSELSNIE